jgi:hypothetical protein
MTGRRKIWIAVAGAATASLVAAWAIRTVSRGYVKTVTGVVLRQDTNIRNQVPIADAEIEVEDVAAKSAASGLFRLNLRPRLRLGEPVAVTVVHPKYETLQKSIPANNELYVFYLKPIPGAAPVSENEVTVTNPRVRYAVTNTSTVNVGSAAETFEVVNEGNIPCNQSKPCSPDGKWKAAISGRSLDAGEGNSFDDARVTCIAGPCPFTRIEKDGFSAGGRRVEVQVRNWSDTATFLFEAEVTHTMETNAIRQSYPARFGQAIDFTLPETAEGPSIEATVGGDDIVFPVSPSLTLTWATCSVTPTTGGGKLFHCDLKRGYRLQ